MPTGGKVAPRRFAHPPVDVFRKQRRGVPPGFFATEAAGLRWLAVPGGPRVARVIDVGKDYLDLERIATARATPQAARDFGRRLATMHDCRGHEMPDRHDGRIDAGSPSWGSLPPGARYGYFGPLDDPLDVPGGPNASWPDWPTFYAQARLTPILAQGRERRVFDSSDAELFAQVSARLLELIGPAGDDVPARLHGDLWSGNVMWAPVRSGVSTGSPARTLEPAETTGHRSVEAVLIDPAAQWGHRENDLAMLALFGAPYLDEILDGYQRQHPLAPGWPGRIPLHQLYPVAAHAVLFGGGYLNQTRAILQGLLSVG